MTPDPGFAVLNDLLACRAQLLHVEQEVERARVLLKRATWAFYDQWVLEAEREMVVDCHDERVAPPAASVADDASAFIPPGVVEHIARCGE